MFRLRGNLRLPAPLVAMVACSGFQLGAPAQVPSQAALQVNPAARQSIEPAQLAIVEIGDSVALGKHYETAIKIYAKAPLMTAAIWNKMGMTYELMLDSGNAIRCYNQSLKLNPNDPRVLNNLGTLYVSMKEYGSADRLFRKALNIDPKYAGIYKNLGTSLIAQHKFSEGQKAYEQAALLDPEVLGATSDPVSESPITLREHGAMNYFMAEACARTGQTSCALEYLQSALNEGFVDPEKVIADSSFAELSGNEGFRKLLAEKRSE